MGAKVIAGVVGFVVLVLVVQAFVLGGGDDSGLNSPGGRTGVAPTATMPAQLPNPIALGQVQAGAGGNGGATTTSGGGTYVVQSGDTLGTIASGFNIPPEEQAAWIAEVLDMNGIQDAHLLQAGQELAIPVRQVAAPVAATPAPGGQGQPQQQGGIATATPRTGTGGGGGGAAGGYVVESGDTPYGIAEKHCVQGAAAWVNELVALNRIDPSNLQVGQTLELPAGTPPRC